MVVRFVNLHVLLRLYSVLRLLLVLWVLVVQRFRLKTSFVNGFLQWIRMLRMLNILVLTFVLQWMLQTLVVRILILMWLVSSTRLISRLRNRIDCPGKCRTGEGPRPFDI